MAASNWKKLLKEASSSWQKAVEESKSGSFGSDVPDGRYYAILTSAEIVESNSSGRMQVAWEVVICEGDYEGSVVRDYDGLETENNLKWLARKLALLGAPVEEMDLAEDLEDVLGQLTETKPKLKIRLRTKNGSDYQNMYFDQVVEEATNYGKASKPKSKAAAPPAKPPAKGKPAPPEDDDEEEDDEEAEKAPAKPVRGAKPAPTPSKPPAKTPSKGKSKPEPEPEPEEEENEDGEEVEVQVGMTVEFVKNNKVMQGTVTKLLNEGTIAQVKTTGGKVERVPIDEDFVVIEDDEGDE